MTQVSLSFRDTLWWSFSRAWGGIIGRRQRFATVATVMGPVCKILRSVGVVWSTQELLSNALCKSIALKTGATAQLEDLSLVRHRGAAGEVSRDKDTGAMEEDVEEVFGSAWVGGIPRCTDWVE